MLAFKFKEDTREYIGTQEAQKNPKSGEYLLPAFCTFVAPPTVQENQIQVFGTTTWTIEKDYRGSWQVKLDDITFSKVDYIGEVQDDYQFISDEVYADYQNDPAKYAVVDGVFKSIENTPEYLQIVKNRKHAENVSKCSEKRYGMTFFITLQGKNCEFDTTSQTQSDLQAAGLVTATGVTYPNWVCNNGVVIDLTNEDVQLVFVQFFGAISPLYTIQLNYTNRINACTTVEEVRAIVIDYDTLLAEMGA